jgi:heme/copper-type cytochrome/quinol oxidase subunit 3
VSGPARALPNGWWGMAILLASEAALLTAMLGAYFYLHFTSPQWPQGAIEAPKVLLPLVLTAVLVASTAPFAAAAAAVKRGADARRWIALALLLQAGYLAAQVVEFQSDLESFKPNTNAYGSIYFTMLAGHHLHVIVGLALDVWLLVRLSSGLTHARMVAVRATALYWYVIAALGVAIVATQVTA